MNMYINFKLNHLLHLGLSVIRGMCSSFSVTICKDLGEYSVTETVAHEIGHKYGIII